MSPARALASHPLRPEGRGRAEPLGTVGRDHAAVTSVHQGEVEGPSDLALAVREIVRIEAELDALRRRHLAVMESLEGGVLLLEATGRVSVCNASALRLLGGEAGLCRWLWNGAQTASGVRTLHPALETLIDGRPRLAVELAVRDPCGTERWLAVNVRPAKIGDGKPAVVCSFADVSLRRARQLDLKRQATVDALTGAFNRRYVEQRLAAEVSRARRHRQPLALALADLDHFKSVNDRHGHAAGDLALRAFVDTLKRTLRTEDVVSRLGGDEFCVIFPGTSAATALERALARLLETDVDGAENPFRISGTFGVADLAPHLDAAGLIARADAALYAAKAAGRGRVVIGLRA